MSRTLLLATGLAAVDGILCAFISILAMAFFLQADEVKSSRESKTTSVEIDWRKSSDGDDEPGAATAKFVARIYLVDKHPGSCELLRFLPVGEEPRRKAVACALGEKEYWIRWQDCTASAGEGSCMARLLISNLRGGEDWKINLRAVDAVGGLESTQASTTFVQPRLISANSVSDTKLVANSQASVRMGDLDGITYTLRVAENGEPELKRLP